MAVLLIRENASYYARITTTISELCHIPTALSHQDAHLRDLEAQMRQSDARLQQLAQTTKKGRKEHESRRNSVARLVVHRLSGGREKSEAQKSDQERFVEALEQEFSEKVSQDVLRQRVDSAKQVHAKLSAKAAQYKSLKEELAHLYARVFDGPTKEFPEHERLEYILQSSQALRDKMQRSLNIERQAVEILTKADGTLDTCQNKIKESLSCTEWDDWGGVGMSDMMGRNSLRMAHSQAKEAELLYRQAQSVSPFIQHNKYLAIARGSLKRDVFLDNNYTDKTFRRKITAAAGDLNRAHKHLKAELDAASDRAHVAATQLKEAAYILRENRAALDAFRSETFRLVLSQDSTITPTNPPPVYRFDSDSSVRLPPGIVPSPRPILVS